MDQFRLFAHAKHLRLVSAGLLEALFTGNWRSVFKGLGIEFDEVREYVENDDARLIDWNISSRMGSAYTKLFREERELILCLIVDLSASIAGGSGKLGRREMLILLFSLLTLAAARNNDKVGALFFTDRIERWVAPHMGRSHALRLMQDVRTLHPAGSGTDLGLALRTVGETLKRRGICVILSDFRVGGYRRQLARLTHRHDVIALRIVDPMDQEFPRSGLIRVVDPETGRLALTYGRSKRFRRHYHDWGLAQRSEWLQECSLKGVSLLEISTNDDPALQLIRFFRRRRK